MLPDYKNDEYYKGYVGKCFRRNAKNEYSVNKILGYDTQTKAFFVEHCYLALGSGVIENYEMNYWFVDVDNYYEISESDYLNIKYLCKSKVI